MIKRYKLWKFEQFLSIFSALNYEKKNQNIALIGAEFKK